jgi:membrane protein YdbS with pleckstrin-like domain
VSWVWWAFAAYVVLAAVAAVVTTWFGWHLRRYRSKHESPHVHTRARWLAEREDDDTPRRY